MKLELTIFKAGDVPEELKTTRRFCKIFFQDESSYELDIHSSIGMTCVSYEKNKGFYFSVRGHDGFPDYFSVDSNDILVLMPDFQDESPFKDELLKLQLDRYNILKKWLLYKKQECENGINKKDAIDKEIDSIEFLIKEHYR